MILQWPFYSDQAESLIPSSAQVHGHAFNNSLSQSSSGLSVLYDLASMSHLNWTLAGLKKPEDEGGHLAAVNSIEAASHTHCIFVPGSWICKSKVKTHHLIITVRLNPSPAVQPINNSLLFTIFLSRSYPALFQLSALKSVQYFFVFHYQASRAVAYWSFWAEVTESHAILACWSFNAQETKKRIWIFLPPNYLSPFIFLHANWLDPSKCCKIFMTTAHCQE